VHPTGGPPSRQEECNLAECVAGAESLSPSRLATVA
jgi:hypothetical protein